MSDKLGGNFSFDTYISKQEGLLVEFIRRQLQAETKVTLLESALQEMYKKNEELSLQLETSKTAFDQSVVGLQAITVERDSLRERVEKLEKLLDSCDGDRGSLRSEVNENSNRVALLHEELKQANSKLGVALNDYGVLKGNYDRVLEELSRVTADKPKEFDASSTSLAAPNKKKAKRPQRTESEWVDGEH